MATQWSGILADPGAVVVAHVVTRHAEIGDNVGEHRLKGEITVGDVHAQHAVGQQPFAVDLQCLTGDEVDGDGVGAEGIDDDQAVLVFWR